MCLTKECSCLKQKSQTPKQPRTPHKHRHTHTEIPSLSHTHSFVNPCQPISGKVTLSCQKHRPGNETTGVKTLDLKIQLSQKRSPLTPQTYGYSCSQTDDTFMLRVSKCPLLTRSTFSHFQKGTSLQGASCQLAEIGSN